MSRKDPKRFYVYAFLRSKDSERGKRRSPYYIGKGNGNRAWSNCGRKIRKPVNEANIVLLRSGLTEKEAFEWERFYIARYGRIDKGTGILHNRADGGEGASGADYSGQRNNFYGRTHKETTRKLLSTMNQGEGNGHYGKKHSLRAKGIMAARHAKYLYELIDSNGEVYMTESLRDFCGQYSLCRRSLTRVLNGERQNHRGWKIRIAETLR